MMSSCSFFMAIWVIRMEIRHRCDATCDNLGKNMGKTWEQVQGSALPVISWFIDHSN
jgi:hypothetical protein